MWMRRRIFAQQFAEGSAGWGIRSICYSPKINRVVAKCSSYRGVQSRSCSRAEAASSHAIAIEPASSDDEFFRGRSEAWVCVCPAVCSCAVHACPLYTFGKPTSDSLILTQLAY